MPRLLEIAAEDETDDCLEGLVAPGPVASSLGTVQTFCENNPLTDLSPQLFRHDTISEPRLSRKSSLTRYQSSESNPASTSTPVSPVLEAAPAPRRVAELHDKLSRFFTPSSARRPRISRFRLAVTLSPRPVWRKQSSRKPVQAMSKPPESTEKTTSKLNSPVREASEPTEVTDTETDLDGPEDDANTSEDAEDTGQKRKKHGSQQLKTLQDGLSGYFTAMEGKRKRKPPKSFTPLWSRYPPGSSHPMAMDPIAQLNPHDQAVAELGYDELSVSTSVEEGATETDVIEELPAEESESEDSDEVEPEDLFPVEKSRKSKRSMMVRTGKPVFKMPDKIPKSMENLCRKAWQQALTNIPTVSEGYDGPLPPRIQLGDKKILTWYTAPFPEEYIRCECLYLCEFCLQYMKTVGVLKCHYEKCPWHRPPGSEIYHDIVENSENEREELVVYETDGNDWKEYCQNLCLIAKLYLDHKTLYYDVESFLFYVLTRRDKYGDHLIGYFSKEKNSPQRYNVSCIMVLPPYQGGGYGRYLIGFSYLLSRVEGRHGTPEKPLSELGEQSYHAYWKSAVLDFFLEQNQKSATTTSIKAICDTTGIWPQDVADTLQELGFIRRDEQTKAYEFSLLQDVLTAYAEKKNSSRKRIPVTADKLRWEPWRDETVAGAAGELPPLDSRAGSW